MTLNEFAAVLTGGGITTYHNQAPDKPGKRYIVWQEYMAKKQTSTPLILQKIQVDFYTREELDKRLDAFLSYLDDAGVFFEEPLTTYDSETGYTRHIIECEIITSRGKG